MSAPSADARQLVRQILESIDPRLKPGIEVTLVRKGPTAAPTPGQTVVLAGHRSAGKTRLLPLVSRLLGRPGVDLDAELERTSGRNLREWVANDQPGFRAAERQALLGMPPGSLVAVGGGFLSHHPDALAGCFTVVVPMTFATYRERLLADTTRPRLRPELSLDEELSSIFHEREALHARVPTVALVDFLRPFARLENS